VLLKFQPDVMGVGPSSGPELYFPLENRVKIDFFGKKVVFFDVFSPKINMFKI